MKTIEYPIDYTIVLNDWLKFMYKIFMVNICIRHIR
nr:MAG TPA: hypothetical protein [Caudoviricetes sp.]